MIIYEIKIKIGDRLGSGINVNVEMVFFDGFGKYMKFVKLDNWFRDDFECGYWDVFIIKDDIDILEVIEIKL